MQFFFTEFPFGQQEIMREKSEAAEKKYLESLTVFGCTDTNIYSDSSQPFPRFLLQNEKNPI